MNPFSTSEFIKLASGGDPLADAVVNDFSNASLEDRMMLNDGLLYGVRSIPKAPKSFRLFLADAEQSVSCFPDILIKQATKPYLLIGPAWMSVSIGCASS